ncbi:MAG: Crp/Fnr family transcriptional regulator [Beijerinckiaceae bacterium]
MANEQPSLNDLLRSAELFTDIFHSIPDEGLADFAALFRPCSYAAGQSIFSAGDEGSYLLVIGSGRVRVSVLSEDGRELSVRHGIAGQVLGEISAFDGGPRTANVTAITAAKGFVLSRTDFERLMLKHPAISLAVIRFLCRRIRETTYQMETIALHPIEIRLARFLLGQLNGREAPSNKRIAVELGFSQTELAQLLGASRPKVNGALKMLEDMKALRRTADRLFCDPALLAQVAEGGRIAPGMEIKKNV